MNTEYQDQVTVFKAFCDENRLQILEMLRSGEKCACKLQENLDIGQSSLSYHMKILCDSGVVASWQVGKWTHYKISEQGCERAKQMLEAISTTNQTDEDTNCC